MISFLRTGGLSLDLRECNLLRKADVASIIRKYGRALRSFDYPSSIDEVDAVHLTSLMFERCEEMEEVVFNDCPLNPLPEPHYQLISGLRRLTALTLIGCENLTDASMHLVFDNCKRLNFLHLSACPRLTDATLEAMTRAKSLTALCLVDNEHMSSHGLKYLSKLQGLKKLIMGADEALYPTFSLAIRDCLKEAFNSRPPLRYLYLGCGRLTDDIMEHVTARLTHLQYLYVRCDYLSDATLKHLADNAKQLETIELDCEHSQFTTEGVVQMIQQLKQLKELTLAPLDPEVITVINQNFPKLRLCL